LVENNEEEIRPLLERAFALLDPDGSGQISGKEGLIAGKALFDGNTARAETWWEEVLVYADEDNSGNVALAEWVDYQLFNYSDAPVEVARGHLTTMIDALEKRTIATMTRSTDKLRIDPEALRGAFRAFDRDNTGEPPSANSVLWAPCHLLLRATRPAAPRACVLAPRNSRRPWPHGVPLAQARSPSRSSSVRSRGRAAASRWARRRRRPCSARTTSTATAS